jgi:hypothetical protein
MVHCGSSVYYYSVLDSAPFPEYNLATSPDIMDTESGISLGAGGHYVHISTDADTSVQAGGGTLSLLRLRLGERSELGITLGLCDLLNITDRSTEPHPFFFFDYKRKLLDRSIILALDPGFGLGGTEADGPAFDVRLAVMLGKRLLGGIIMPYVSPTAHALLYIFQRESHGLSSSVHYGLAPTYGITAGFDFNAYAPSKSFQLHLVPECSVLRGHETTTDDIIYLVIKPSFMLRAVF